MNASRMTSATHPLRIDSVVLPSGGRIGMTICPGKKLPASAHGYWNRDLERDIDVIRAWDARAVVTLLGRRELEALRVARMGQSIVDAGMAWHWLPIRDGDVPGAAFESAWASTGPHLRALLVQGARILIHCRGGLGRTGTIAARLLIEMGWDVDAAIAEVRRNRPGAIETVAQQRYVRLLG